jgi:hypothetical protein
MTRELHVYDHYGGVIAILFVDPDGAVEAFDNGESSSGCVRARSRRQLTSRWRRWVPTACGRWPKDGSRAAIMVVDVQLSV